MPTLSVRIIKKPRKYRRCDNCGKALDGETIKLFGMADYGDKPYNVFLHRSCVGDKETLGKIRAAELLRAPVAPMQICPSCNGYGTLLDTEANAHGICSQCDGTGQI